MRRGLGNGLTSVYVLIDCGGCFKQKADDAKPLDLDVLLAILLVVLALASELPCFVGHVEDRVVKSGDQPSNHVIGIKQNHACARWNRDIKIPIRTEYGSPFYVLSRHLYQPIANINSRQPA